MPPDAAFDKVAWGMKSGSRRPNERVEAPGYAVGRGVLGRAGIAADPPHGGREPRIAPEGGGLVQREQPVAPEQRVVLGSDQVVQYRIKNTSGDFFVAGAVAQGGERSVDQAMIVGESNRQKRSRFNLVLFHCGFHGASAEAEDCYVRLIDDGSKMAAARTTSANRRMVEP